MITRNSHRWPCAAGLTLAVAALVAGAAPGRAQLIVPGNTRVEMSDATGANVSSLLRFNGGTAMSMSCPVAWGVRTTSERLTAEMSGARYRVLPARGDAFVASTAVQQRLLTVLRGTRDRTALAVLEATLAPNMNVGARRSAGALVRQLNGLLAQTDLMDPADPGYRAPTQLTGAVSALNRFVNASSPEYLKAAPQEFLAIRATLAELVKAGIEQSARTVDRASQRARTSELACAPPPEQVFAAPTPERAVIACIATPSWLRHVRGRIDATGDTVVSFAGGDRPLREVFPERAARATNAPWYLNAQLVSFAGESFIRYGKPFTPAADMVTAGTFGGIPLLVGAGQSGLPGAVYVLVGAGCTVQEYRRLVEICTPVHSQPVRAVVKRIAHAARALVHKAPAKKPVVKPAPKVQPRPAAKPRPRHVVHRPAKPKVNCVWMPMGTRDTVAIPAARKP